MPDRTPPLVKTTTATTGTATYVLSTTALSSSHRTASQAVIDGDLFDGDTVFYVCRDTTLGNDDKFVEWGIGTYNDGANTVTRDTIIAGSNGPGTPVSWGLSGTRDFYLTTVPDPARLASANVFIENQTIDKTTPSFFMIDGGNVAEIRNSFSILTLGMSTAGISVIRLDPFPALNSNAELQIFRNTDVGSGNASVIGFEADGSGTIKWVIDSKTGVGIFAGLESGDGNPYEHFESTANPGAGVPTRLVFNQTTPPLGWTQDTSNTEAALRVVSGTGGGSGGTIALTGSSVSSSTTITIATMPAHDHDIDYLDPQTLESGVNASAIQALGSPLGGGPTTVNTASEGGGGSHNHSIDLKFDDVIRAEKD